MSDLFDLPFEDEDPETLEEPGPPATDEPPTPQRPSRTLLTVTALTIALRDAIQERFSQVWVEGELSNCKVWNNGHLYFTLKDSSCQIRGFMFRSSLRYLRFKPEDGLHVVARGRVTVYEPRGEYQLLCEHLEPQGFGALQLAFEQLKKRLQSEGLFDAARKRPLPALPRKIGVVTSLDGAAVRDIIKVLGRRYRNAQIVIRPARVQGEGAAADIARGLRAIARVPGVDVIIVGRGGGSIEDLWAFNEEVVARAIAQAAVPVISAVGHETDTTIADFVADRRAPTPSAAAEIVVAAHDEFCGRVDRLRDRLTATARARVQGLSRRVHMLSARPSFAGFPARVALHARRTSEVSSGLAQLVRQRTVTASRQAQQLRRRLDACDLGRRFAAIRARLVNADGRLELGAARRYGRADALLRDCASRLEALSPLAVLGRGYAVAWNDERTRVLRNAGDVSAGDRIRVTLANGELGCDVRSIRRDE